MKVLPVLCHITYWLIMIVCYKNYVKHDSYNLVDANIIMVLSVSYFYYQSQSIVTGLSSGWIIKTLFDRLNEFHVIERFTHVDSKVKQNRLIEQKTDSSILDDSSKLND